MEIEFVFSFVAFNPDGRTLTAGNWEEIHRWNATTGKHLNTIRGPMDRVYSGAFNSDGHTLAFTLEGESGKEIHLWNATTGKHLNTIQADTDDVSSVAFSPDGHTLAAGGIDEIRLWDATTGKHLNTLRGDTDIVYSVAFSPDGRTLAAGGRTATVCLWDTTTGQPLNTLRGQTDVVYSVAFSPDGRTLATESGDGTVLLWNLRVLEELLASLTPKETAVLDNYPHPANPETWIPFQLAKSAEVTVSIYTEDGKPVRTLEFGQLPAGVYQSQSRAVYWDGRNAQGEPVANGVYLYTLQAGDDFSTTRGMIVMRK